MSKVTFPHVPPIVRDPCESHKQALTNYLNEANCVIRLGGDMDAKGLGNAEYIKAFAIKVKHHLTLLGAMNSSIAKTSDSGFAAAGVHMPRLACFPDKENTIILSSYSP